MEIRHTFEYNNNKVNNYSVTNNNKENCLGELRSRIAVPSRTKPVSPLCQLREFPESTFNRQAPTFIPRKAREQVVVVKSKKELLVEMKKVSSLIEALEHIAAKAYIKKDKGFLTKCLEQLLKLEVVYDVLYVKWSAANGVHVG